MLYFKNLPIWERLLRNGVGIGLIAYAWMGMGGPWRWVVFAGAVSLIMTGLIGFCPACAMAGRRLKQQGDS